MRTPNCTQVLDWDVLINCAPFITTKYDVLSFMYTCRTLYEARIPVLLAPPLHLESLAKVVSFCKFIVKDDRARHIRSLSLGDYYNPVNAVDSLLEQYPRLSSVISSFKKLEEIRLKGVGKQTREVLRKMTSPVTSADISFADVHTMFEHAITHPDPTLLLQNFRETLKTLSVSCTSDPLVFPFHSEARFPYVWRLAVESGWEPSMKVFMDAFPNVSELQWSYFLADDLSWDQAQRARIENTLDNVDGWPTLDKLDAGVVPCYTSAMTSRVRVWRAGPIYRAWKRRPFHIVMGTLQPTALQLSVQVAKFSKLKFCTFFPASFVKELDFTLDFHKCTLPAVEVLVCFSLQIYLCYAQSLIDICRRVLL